MRGLFLIVIMIMCFVYNGNSQEFVITDYSLEGKVEYGKILNAKEEWLGGGLTLKFFDNAVRLENMYDGKGVIRAESKITVLQKQYDGTYMYYYDGNKTTLKLVSILGYLSSATLTSCDFSKGHDKEIIVTLKLKRK